MFAKRSNYGKNITTRSNWFCSQSCRFAYARARGGRWVNKEGYVVIPLPERKPTLSKAVQENTGYVRVNLGKGNTTRSDGRILEHRWVMEQHLGRELHPDETVRHKNGNKADNSIGNLELWSSRHPKGQRVEDIADWAVEMLGRYRPDLLAAPVADTG